MCGEWLLNNVVAKLTSKDYFETSVRSPRLRRGKSDARFGVHHVRGSHSTAFPNISMLARFSRHQTFVPFLCLNV